MNDRVQQIRHGIQTARRMTLGLIEDVPTDRWTWQSFAGQNHVAWTLMHLALSDDWGPTALGRPEKQFVGRYGELVAAGPSADPAGWPRADEILDILSNAHARFLACLDEIQDADLARKTSGPIAQYAPDLGTVLTSHIWHEGFHDGQLSVIRKALGMPPRFG